MPKATGPGAPQGGATDAEPSAPNSPPAGGNNAPPTFEAGLQQLETIVKEMEGGDLPLERALQLFELGMKLSDTCRKQLEEAETRIEILTRRAGEIQPQPFPSQQFPPQQFPNDK